VNEYRDVLTEVTCAYMQKENKITDGVKITSIPLAQLRETETMYIINKEDFNYITVIYYYIKFSEINLEGVLAVTKEKVVYLWIFFIYFLRKDNNKNKVPDINTVTCTLEKRNS
jgi:hypothetical protein